MSHLMMLAPAVILAASVETIPTSRVPAIQSIKNVRPKSPVSKGATPTKPLVLKSVKDAAKYFDQANIARLKKQVDFKRQTVLIFAWQGSGRDQLVYDIGESYPEQIHFLIKRGLSDDLKRHVYVFALRSNVTWRVRLLR